jgi:hypothetical protein
MHTDRFGISLICCGLDHWFDESEEKDIQEFIIDDEWRIKRDLRVQHLRLPPDYRRGQTGVETPNTGMTIPFLRFPTWHYCSICGKMEKTALTYQGTGSQKTCPVCLQKNAIRNPLVQVRFIAVCEHGHIMEFPWKEWAHQSHSPDCGDDSLRLVEYGGGTLESIEVSCTECGRHRRLNGITSSGLSVDGEEFSCTGQRLWLHDEEGSGCGKSIRGSLRNASNIYFARVFSSIFLPRHSAPAKAITSTTADIIHAMERPSVSARLDTLLEMGIDFEAIIKTMRVKHNLEFKEYSDEEIVVALGRYSASDEEKGQNDEASQENEPFDRGSFRLEEYRILTQEWDEPYLMSRTAALDIYSSRIQRCFSKIMLIHKLRETRVFTGFTRLTPVSGQSPLEIQNHLWLKPPDIGSSWLPAAIIHGEGLFFEFNNTTLHQWLEGDDGAVINKRIEELSNNFFRATADRPSFELINELHPAFIMIHTFAHLLMNQLTYECGYSSAALRERLYFSSSAQTPMAGLLIYTAAGDSEGTMGGLVRMGQPTLFEPLLQQAIRKAQWCSADPVCMELGDYGGQGPNSCNLAACHNCALVPETACEEFNRFLDRGVVTGTVANRSLGFFNMFTE